MVTGYNGDFAYSNTGDPLVEFFSKAGSVLKRGKNRPYYGDNKPCEPMDLFIDAFATDELKAFKLAMWLRDCRGGAGVRGGFRDILVWLSITYPSWVNANIHLVPLYGRWDDLIVLMGTTCEDTAIELWVDAIKKQDGLACKWAPREKSDKATFHKLRKKLKLSPGDFRKTISTGTNVVETAMCNNDWSGIEYNHVPSVAMARSFKAFSSHDEDRFASWKTSLADPESGNKINASVLFPHDCIRMLKKDLGQTEGYYGWSHSCNQGNEVFADSELANAAFAALPNFMGETDMRIISLCDFSYSMCTEVAGEILAIDVSMALGLYCSDRLGEDSPFYRKFIPFSTDSRLVDWNNDTFSVAAQKYNDGFVGSTNITAALDQILDAATFLNATNDQIPNCLLILSDMQWDTACSNGSSTAVEQSMVKWENAGYTRPRIVLWDLNPYDTSPATVDHKDTAMVSGFSPSILGAVLSGDDFTPRGVMEKAIQKYEVVDPR